MRLASQHIKRKFDVKMPFRNHLVMMLWVQTPLNCELKLTTGFIADFPSTQIYMGVFMNVAGSFTKPCDDTKDRLMKEYPKQVIDQYIPDDWDNNQFNLDN